MNIRENLVNRYYWSFVNRAGAVVVMPIKWTAFEKQCKSPGFKRTSLMVGNEHHHIAYGPPATAQLARHALSDTFFNDLPGAYDD